MLKEKKKKRGEKNKGITGGRAQDALHSHTGSAPGFAAPLLAACTPSPTLNSPGVAVQADVPPPMRILLTIAAFLEEAISFAVKPGKLENRSSARCERESCGRTAGVGERYGTVRKY